MQTGATPIGASDVVLYRAVQSRRRQAATIACLLAAFCRTPPAAGQSFDTLSGSRFVKQSERVTPEGGSPIELQFAIARGAEAQTARVVRATTAALTMLAEWFGPFPTSPFTVIGADWMRPGTGFSDVTGAGIAAPLHWIAPVRDQSMERAIIGGLVREYWKDRVAAPPSPFSEALIRYISLRAMHQQLEGSNFAAPRFFGGFAPFPLRSLLLSPPVADPRPRVWAFDDRDERRLDPDVTRHLRALQTIERYVGWPAMLQALSEMRAGSASPATQEGLAATLSATRGVDMRWLVTECFREDAAFDYAVDALSSGPAANGSVATTITIVRKGTGQFTLQEDDDREAVMPLLVRFADGSEFRDVFDGAAPSTSLTYTAPAAAVSAFVDPDAMLLLDGNRDNNAIVHDAPMSKLGVRLALHWMSWLQNAMLSYTALL
jgi:hypothetical protein